MPGTIPPPTPPSSSIPSSYYPRGTLGLSLNIIISKLPGSAQELVPHHTPLALAAFEVDWFKFVILQRPGLSVSVGEARYLDVFKSA